MHLLQTEKQTKKPPTKVARLNPIDCSQKYFYRLINEIQNIVLVDFILLRELFMGT